MLRSIDLAPVSLDMYEPVVGRTAIQRLHDMAQPLRGKRIAHINATSYGGGVSELLRSTVPLYRAFGIPADWLVMPGSGEFFEVTKDVHNALQGAELNLTEDFKATYLRQNQLAAQLFDGRYDFVLVHDPQPVPLRMLSGDKGARWIWRCHIDTSHPNAEVLAFLEPFIAAYDALVFTLPEFVPPQLREHRIEIIAPAIDPVSPKNMAVPVDLCRRIVSWTGLSLRRPLLTQISRFDPWKDPLGVIDVFRSVRERLPSTQLALLGQMALDDPEGWRLYSQIQDKAARDEDIHVLTNFTGIGNMEVNAFQSCSQVVLQKSIREGFGLVVSEALWKGTPVVAGHAGGIPLQMPKGIGGYLATEPPEFVERIVQLLTDPAEAQALGTSGRDHVRDNFLITRLLANEFALLASLA